MRKSIFYLLTFLLFSCGAHKKSEENKQSEKLVVTTVNYPLFYFAQRIGGELIQLEYPIPADVDPAYWIPDDDALAIYQSADIILTNGADYAKWINNVSLPASRIVNSSISLEGMYIQLKDVFTHSHGPEGKHEHTGFAFTTWLDFAIAVAQAEAVKASILNKLPENEEEIDENFSSLKTELMTLHENMKAVSNKIGEQNIIASHPVYQYLSEAYGLNIHSVHFEPDEMPSEDQWEEFNQLLERHPAKIMLWEDEPLSEVMELLKSKGIQVVVFNPCGNKPVNADFITIMQKNIKSLSEAMKSS